MTGEVAISARGLSKQYTRGPETGWTLHQGFANLVLSPYRRLRGRPPVATTEREAFWALKDVTFDVRRGERVGIIGANGAGKTTLLKILSRVVYPTEGEARIRGRVTSLLEVGTGFNPNMTGRENIYLNASIHGLSRREIDARYDDIVEFSQIRPFIDTPIKRYSSGMRARLAFAVAAHLDPDILMMDEVLAVGDLSFQQQCLRRVYSLTSEGRTLLFVSHSLEAIARFCDRCIWLERGRIRRDGEVQDVLTAYREEMLEIQASRSWAVVEPSGADGAGRGGSGAARSETATQVNGTRPLTPAEVPPDLAQAPGDDYARLISARVIDRDGRTVTSTAVEEPIGIEITYAIIQGGKNVQPALHFKTAADEYAFVVAYTEPERMQTPPELGRYVATAWVPGNLLNIGTMYVTVALATPDPMERHCIVERAIAFNVYETMDAADTARGLYAREFPGLVRPKLRWETRSLDADSVAAPRPLRRGA